MKALTKKDFCYVCQQKEITHGEEKVLEWQQGYSGGFYLAFWKTVCLADDINLTMLELGFPSEIQAFRDYKSGVLESKIKKILTAKNRSGKWKKLRDKKYVSQTCSS
jgi:hypothetical protein